MHIPLIKADTRPFDILDANNAKIGTVQRNYNGRLTRILDLIFDGFVINIIVKDINGIKIASCEEILSIKNLLREKWQIKLLLKEETYTFTALSKTIINTNPRISYKKNNLEILVSKNIGDKKITFSDMDSREVFAEITPKGIIPPHSNKIDIYIHNPVINIFELSCIFYLFQLKN
jgi:hypothetical protein